MHLCMISYGPDYDSIYRNMGSLIPYMGNDPCKPTYDYINENRGLHLTP